MSKSVTELTVLPDSNDQWVWHNLIEEMLVGHGETARTIRFAGKPKEVERGIHSGQVALIHHRTVAIRAGRLRNYVPAIMKRGDKLHVFNRPVAEYRKYVHRAPADVMAILENLARKARGED